MKTASKGLLVLKVVVDMLTVFISWLLAGFLRFYVIPGGRLA